MKNNEKVMVLILCIMFVGSLIFLKMKEVKLEVVKDTNLPLYTKVNVNNLIKVKNATITSSNKRIDTSKLGKQRIKISTIDHFGKKRHFTFEVKVIDESKPVIKFKKVVKTKKGVKPNLLKNVKVIDNSKENIKAKVSGNYDINYTGTYNLEYIAKDSSGNTAREKFKLVVE